jgi:hypothetical protein
LGSVINNDFCIRGESVCRRMINFFWFHHEHSICAFHSSFVISLAHTSEILSKGHLPRVGSEGVIHELLVAGYCFAHGWVHHLSLKFIRGVGGRVNFVGVSGTVLFCRSSIRSMLIASWLLFG